MRRTDWILVAALALSVPCAATLVTRPARAATESDLDTARALIEEARPWVKQADNTDLPNAARKKGRREAYKRLKAARKLYDAYLDGHPSEIEALDSEYVDCASMIYWVKKMASINEFDSSDDTPVELPKIDPEPESESDGGGIGGTSRRGDDPAKDDPPPTDEEPAAEEKPAPEPVDPMEEMARRARETLAAIEAEERANPGDVPRLHALYEKYLAAFPDPSLPEYTTAALRLGALTDRMKTVFKETVGSDPDALKNVDSKEITRVVARLGKLMKARAPEDRRRGAQLLGACGSGSAAIYLARGIRDKDQGVRDLSSKGLVALGGSRVANNLVKLYRESKQEAQISAVEVLERIAEKGPVDARTMSFYLGRFVLSRDQAVAGRSLDFLASLGPAGGPGLVEALDTRIVQKKIEVISAIGSTKYYQGAFRLSLFLLQGDVRKTVSCRKAAIEALKNMGEPVIPYLIPNLKDRRVRLWTAHVMNQIGGVRFGSNDAKKWRKWCEERGYTVEK